MNANVAFIFAGCVNRQFSANMFSISTYNAMTCQYCVLNLFRELKEAPVLMVHQE